ncbi:PfaD family polyunsaturated fatty acid/polyketide biosynthesis protein [Roseibium sp. RKSG952]|uniref:PfaD family polyunsaturated fatty acid/polyketide biosynthesis protein n=1 Tax=Roseibium sp. RKSG952 TaxID=2529384 RepID=UPI0012BC29F2|nr:PfaD family polyunsaturated fatty acid/polyketide biosynthesis protein [Roseibium sp. RKSG952]MTH96160.1 PfaD family polyunsaturated fatty acid/polyketide biosynthesis protein [Roseibium sp. RKSG952]
MDARTSELLLPEHEGLAGGDRPPELRQERDKHLTLLQLCLDRFRDDAVIVSDDRGHRWAGLTQKSVSNPDTGLENNARDVVGSLPGIFPEWLGNRDFGQVLDCRFPYVCGEMARGIASPEMVIEAVKAGFAGFFGSAGLRVPVVRDAILSIREAVGENTAWGMNLIHSPDRPERETELVDLFLAEGVANVSASAFMRLSKDVVRFSAAGLHVSGTGGIVRKTRVFAKISRPEVASAFLLPPPEKMLAALVQDGAITEQQAELQRRLPVAEFITVEADSGGHTDGRPLGALFPAIRETLDRAVERYGYDRPVFLGAAGGIGTPAAVASAFAIGADYVLTGSINQASVEANLSDDAKAMLCEADVADIALAPAADMFEIGAKVQVLKKGTLFATTGQRLDALYRRYQSLDELPARDREWVEKKVLRQPFDAAWAETRAYHARNKPDLVARADTNDKLKLALVFKRFLFLGSQWARDGNADRRLDYQVWCGPAMGAFNTWAHGTFLAEAQNRTVRQIGLNLLEGATRITRAQQLRSCGVAVPAHMMTFRPVRLELG